MSVETRRHLKPVGSRPGIMYGSCKDHKNVWMAVHLSDQLSALQTPMHKLAKYLVAILEPLTTNKYRV